MLLTAKLLYLVPIHQVNLMEWDQNQAGGDEHALSTGTHGGSPSQQHVSPDSCSHHAHKQLDARQLSLMCRVSKHQLGLVLCIYKRTL